MTEKRGARGRATGITGGVRAGDAGQPDRLMLVTASARASAVADATTAEEFVGLLNELRESLGLSYTQIGQKAGKGMSRSTAQAMMKRETLPPRHHVRLFLQACKVSAVEFEVWFSAFDRIAGIDRPVVPAPPDRPQQLPSPAAPPRQKHIPGRPAPELEPRDEPPAAAPRPRDRRAARAVQTQSVLAVAVLMAVFTGCTIAMWSFGVPGEVIIVVFAVVLVAVFCWTAVMRTTAEMSAPPPRRGVAFHDASDTTDDNSDRPPWNDS